MTFSIVAIPFYDLIISIKQTYSADVPCKRHHHHPTPVKTYTPFNLTTLHLNHS